jgi:transcriptional regulator with XRE-family HTH domain
MEFDLKTARKNRGMTLSQLAAQLGVTTGQVSHWERGRNRIPNDKAVALAKIFKVPIEQIETKRSASYPSQSWISKIVIDEKSAPAAFIESLKADFSDSTIEDETSIEAAFIAFVEKHIAESLRDELAKHPEIGEQLRKKYFRRDLTKR